ncbi:MAG: hypothetical protein C0482_29690 [Gordonia sp.]|nr:hypothetical protein [Gordonia sp. (in: high G+C Gram-positive bacteria)]
MPVVVSSASDGGGATGAANHVTFGEWKGLHVHNIKRAVHAFELKDAGTRKDDMCRALDAVRRADVRQYYESLNPITWNRSAAPARKRTKPNNYQPPVPARRARQPAAAAAAAAAAQVVSDSDDDATDHKHNATVERDDVDELKAFAAPVLANAAPQLFNPVVPGNAVPGSKKNQRLHLGPGQTFHISNSLNGAGSNVINAAPPNSGVGYDPNSSSEQHAATASSSSESAIARLLGQMLATAIAQNRSPTPAAGAGQGTEKVATANINTIGTNMATGVAAHAEAGKYKEVFKAQHIVGALSGNSAELNHFLLPSVPSPLPPETHTGDGQHRSHSSHHPCHHVSVRSGRWVTQAIRTRKPQGSRRSREANQFRSTNDRRAWPVSSAHPTPQPRGR